VKILTILLGTSFSSVSVFILDNRELGFGFYLFLTTLISTSVLLLLVLIYPTIKHKKLVSKYRDSEEGLIKP
jgi:uncharacterized membrane protein